MESREPRGRDVPPGSELGRWAVLFLLCGFAVAQPLYEILGRGPEFFVARRSRPIDLWILLGAVSWVLPTVLWGLIWGARRLRRRLGAAAYRIVLAGLVTLLLRPGWSQLGLEAGGQTLLLLGAVLLGAASVPGRWIEARSGFTISLLLAGGLTFPVSFLMAPGIAGVAGLEAATTPTLAAQPERRLSAPVVIVVFDELALATLRHPDGGIDDRRFPSFARFAEDATWYTEATSVANATALAIPALLTGNYPNHGQLPNYQGYPQNLFSLLGSANDFVVFESITQLCPEEACGEIPTAPLKVRLRSLAADLKIVLGHLLLPADWVSDLPPIDNNWGGFAASTAASTREVDGPENQIGYLNRFLDALEPTEDPALYYLHLLLPHVPWEYSPTGKRYGPLDRGKFPHGLARERWSEDPWHVVQGFQRYLHQAAFTDRLLGQILDRLEEVELYDEALVVVLADHGVSFQPGDSRRELTDTNAAELLPVPLLVKRPQQREGGESDRNVEIIDVVPTVMDLTEGASDDRLSFDGYSLLEGSAVRNGKWAVRTGDGAKIHFTDPLVPSHQAVLRLAEIDDSLEDPWHYAIGPYRDLWRRPLSELVIEGDAELSVDLDWPEALSAVDPADAFQPVHLTGSLVGSAPEPVHLLVALNGVVQALTRSYFDGEEHRFSAMVAEDALVPGSNDVELFRLRSGPEPRLRRIGDSNRCRWKLVTAEIGREWLECGGDVATIDSRRLAGYLDRFDVREGSIELAGWAADIEALRVAERVLLIGGDQVLASGRTHVERTGLRQRYGEALRYGGFLYRVPSRVIDAEELGPLRVLALLPGGTAAELEYPFGFPAFGEHRLERSDVGAEHLVLPDRTRLPVTGGDGIKSRFSTARRTERGLILAGWALDAARSQAPLHLYLFADDEFVHRTRFLVERSDLAAEHGISDPVGFHLRVDLAAFETAEEVRWRLLATFERGEVVEFDYAPVGAEASGGGGFRLSSVVESQ